MGQDRVIIFDTTLRDGEQSPGASMTREEKLRIARSGAVLQLYSINAITEGTDSQGEVTVRLEKNGRIVNGNGADTDIVVASAKAYINALNLMHSGVPRAHPQEGI